MSKVSAETVFLRAKLTCCYICYFSII